MKNQISVIIKTPNGKPYKALIDNELDALQAIVGGDIEALPVYGATKPMLMIVNEEGKLRNLPYNFATEYDFIVGTCFFCGVDGEEFGDCPVSVPQIERFIENGGVIV